jgi:hypothetical protein
VWSVCVAKLATAMWPHRTQHEGLQKRNIHCCCPAACYQHTSVLRACLQVTPPLSRPTTRGAPNMPLLHSGCHSCICTIRILGIVTVRVLQHTAAHCPGQHVEIAGKVSSPSCVLRGPFEMDASTRCNSRLRAEYHRLFIARAVFDALGMPGLVVFSYVCSQWIPVTESFEQVVVVQLPWKVVHHHSPWR